MAATVYGEEKTIIVWWNEEKEKERKELIVCVGNCIHVFLINVLTAMNIVN